MTTQVLDGQNMVDIAIQETGSVEGLVGLVIANGKSVTSFLQIEEVLETQSFNNSIVKYYRENNKKIATGSFDDSGFSVGFSVGFKA